MTIEIARESKEALIGQKRGILCLIKYLIIVPQS
jgi:hypothetical protein